MFTIQNKKNLAGMSIGIRFGPSFSICDESGKIADDILYSDSSYFNSKFFPLVNKGTLETRLENPKTGDYLTLSNRDLILNLYFSDPPIQDDPNINPKLRVDDLKDVYSAFESILVLLQQHEFDRIQRIGYVNKYVFDKQDLTHAVVKNIIGNTIDGVSDMVLRFSKRYPVPQGLEKKDVKDYHNVIYTVAKNPDSNDLFINLDYQEFYSPHLQNAKQIKFREFLTQMDRYNRETFPHWLTSIGEKQVE